VARCCEHDDEPAVFINYRGFRLHGVNLVGPLPHGTLFKGKWRLLDQERSAWDMMGCYQLVPSCSYTIQCAFMTREGTNFYGAFVGCPERDNVSSIKFSELTYI
jgi:hypothetical protein